MPDTDQGRLQGEDGRRIQELAALYAVSVAMNQALSEQEALYQALCRVLEVLDLESGRIYLLDGKTRQLALAASAGNPLFLDPAEAPINPGECLCGLALQEDEPLFAADAAADPRVSRLGCRQHHDHACAAVPLLAKDRMLGVLHVATRRHMLFSSGEMALLRSIGAQIGVATENMRLREEARKAEALSVLIAEMHHRIKNNLQTVADLLSLEMSSSSSPEARHSLRDSINRIKSIAAVHQLLSSEQLRLTNITELASQVCNISLAHQVRPGQQVDVNITGPPVYLPSKQATALALVLNELISNALEHAFGDGRSGTLTIVITQQEGQVTFSLTDNGAGLPPGFNLESQDSLGLQIVRTLVDKDLAGRLRFDRPVGGGSRATLTFYR